MKYIVKGQEPQSFTDWKNQANEDWQPSYDILSGNVKSEVKRSLISEQFAICCYCESRLYEDDSHIEHFQPQSDQAVDALDYSNMLCSCQKQISKGEPRHCGNLKDSWFNPLLLVSPLQSDCAARFIFTGEGHISAANPDDTAVQETISRLGLGLPKLNALREEAIAPFLDESLDDESLQQFVSGYLSLDSKGQLGAYFTTIQYLFQSSTSV